MFDFFIKLFKAFNSSQTPWQMSLAITLGMAMGLTPFSGLQSILIIFVVLIINVHLGLFLVSSGFFAGFAYLLDPTFEALGYSILTNPEFKDFFTYAYNSGLMRLTNFNNTLVIGSNIIAFSLLIPIYFVLNSIVYIYRDKIALALQKFTIFKAIGVNVSEDKDKFFRIWGLGVFIILVGVIVSFILVFLNPLVKMGLEKTISKATNKNVQIDNVDVLLNDGKLNINNLNIFENKTSLFKAKNISASIDFNQLLFNRYHIKNINLEAMEFNQVTDAKVENKQVLKNKEKESSSSALSFDTPSLPKPETLISRMGLNSTKNYEEAQSQFDGIEKKYKNALENDFSKKELKNIKSDASKIKADLNKIKKIKKLKSEHYVMIKNSLEDIKKLRKKLKQKKGALKSLKKDFKNDKKSLVGYSNKIIDGAKGDYENLSKNYKFNTQGGVNVVGVLFGDGVKGYLNTFLTYYELAKPYLKSEEEPPVPSRGEGRWIKYKDLNAQVDMLIENVDVTGVYDSNIFAANIKNISSNQKLLNKYAKLKIKSEGKLSKKIDLGLVKLNNANYSVDVDAKTFDYESFISNAKLNYTKTNFSSKKLNNLKEFKVDIKMNDKISSPNVKVKSDLDDKLKSIFEKAIKQQLTKYKKRLRTLIDTQMNDELKKLGLKDKEVKKLEKLLNSSLDDFSNTETLLSRYEKDLKSQSKNKAKDKAKELIKSFKF